MHKRIFISRTARLRKNLSRAFIASMLMLLPFVITHISPAGFSSQETRTFVEIDGVKYGRFDHIGGLEDSDAIVDPEGKSYKTVSFRRDFVTDPSLYLWAKNSMHDKTGLKDVHVVMENRDGEELSRYVLKFCQPLAWSVEAAEPSLGGFHEKVDLAVQEISVY